MNEAKKAILKAIIDEPIKEKAQKGQKLLTDAILDLFKKYPDRSWTAGPITEKLGLYEGYKTGEGGNHWLAQGFLTELKQKKIIKHLGKPSGYKLNPE